jgi:hypothetical protein
MLGILSLIMWGFTFGIWYYFGYYWEGWEPYSALLTFFVLPIPFIAYYSFFVPRQHRTPTSGESGPPSTTTGGPASIPIRLLTPTTDPDWITWLGKGDSHRGVLVVALIIFWSILYWNWPEMQFTAVTFSWWGLLTLIGIAIIRTLFRRPGQEVPGSAESKSKPKQ